MSSGEVRRVSRQDIQLVQNLIERCLQLYMNQREVVETLLVQAKIEPGFTELVWQKLEEENRDFFKAYYVRLMLKNQIVIFNKLLEQQVGLMHKMAGTGVVSVPASNGSLNSSSLHPAPPCFVPENTVHHSVRPDSMNHQLSCPASTFLNEGLSPHQSICSPNGNSFDPGKMDVQTNIHLMQTSHVGVLHGMNDVASKSNHGCSNSSSFMWNGHDDSALDTPSTVGGPSITSFSSTGPSSQPMPVTTFSEVDTSSFGFLGQIPRNFSLSDLTADFSQSSDILESYSRSPFLATDDLLDSPGRECHGKRLLLTFSVVMLFELTGLITGQEKTTSGLIPFQKAEVMKILGVTDRYMNGLSWCS